MKNITAFVLFTFVAANLFGQNPAKKYILMEHFTNSKCSICASKNPAFYNTINQAANAANIHHLSIHPSVPYPDCVFYQANTAENQALANFYGIPGTPRLYVNGTATTGSALITQAKIDAAAAETSPIRVLVSETPNPNGSIDVKVTIETGDAAGISGDHLLYVAVAEKVINQTTPNGESVHHDVFRDMLTPVAGSTITLPAVGQSAVYNYNYTVAANWKASEVFVTAYVRNVATKLILQSGTRFDPIVLGTSQIIDNQLVSIFPNPATDEVSLATDHIIIDAVDVFNMAGQQISAPKTGLGSSKVSIKTADFTPGVYFTKVKTSRGTTFGKFVKN